MQNLKIKSHMAHGLDCLALDGGGWDQVEKLTNSFNARIDCFAIANLPERGKWHAGCAGEVLHLRMAQGSQTRPDASGGGDFLFHAHTVPQTVFIVNRIRYTKKVSYESVCTRSQNLPVAKHLLVDEGRVND